MSDAPRVAQLVHSLDGRSVGRIALRLADAFERMGVQCHVITTAVEADSSLRPHRLAVLGPARPTAKALPRLAKVLWSIRPQALIAHVSGPNLTAALGRVLGLVRVPRLVLVEHVEWLTHPNWTHRWLRAVATRWLYARADAIVGVSPGVCKGLERLAPRLCSRLRVIPPPVVAESLLALADEPADDPWFEPTRELPVVVTVGNVIARKGHETLIRAVACLQAHGYPVNAAIIGRYDDPPLLARLQSLAQELRVSDRVRFLGYQDNPLRYVARADLFVLTSSSEGFGMALVEAMACGIPCISTDAPGGPRWICEDGRAGILVPGGSPPELAQAIRNVLDDPALRHRMSEAGLRRAKDFEVTTVARQYLEVAGVLG